MGSNIETVSWRRGDTPQWDGAGWRQAAAPTANYFWVFNGTTGLWAATSPAAVAALLDHGTLTGLGDDDHAQYALLDGRAGGQVLIGGTNSGDKLRLVANDDGDGEVEVNATNTGATGAQLALYQDSASPAVNDVAGIITGYAKSANGTKTAITAWNGIVTDVTAGAMSSAQAFRTLDSNTARDIYMDPNWGFLPNDNDFWPLGGSSNRWTKVWTKDLDFSGTLTGTVTAANIANRTRSLTLPAAMFTPGGHGVAACGANALQGVGQRYTAQPFDGAGAFESNVACFVVPQDYVSGASFLIHWTNLGAGAGDVRWTLLGGGKVDGNDLNAAVEFSTTTTATAPALGIEEITTHAAAPTFAAGELVLISVARDSADAADTLANDAGFIALVFQYTADM